MSNSNNNGQLGEKIVLVPLFAILRPKGYLCSSQFDIFTKEIARFSSTPFNRLDGYFEGEPFAPDGFNISVKYKT